MAKITTFLMFDGTAESAMEHYMSLFRDASVTHISRYGEGEEGPAGTVRHALFRLEEQEFMCIDSSMQHAFTFTPAMSLYVTCETEAEVDRLFAGLSEGGEILMPLGPYPFSRKYSWVSDKFGVSWQLSLADQ